MLVHGLAFMGLSLMLASLLGGLQGESLIFLWVMMEINLVGFILFSHSASSRGEFLFKYFIIQSIGSALLLLAVLAGSASKSAELALGAMALLLKLGAAPLHSWFITLMMKSEWGVLIALSYPQKFLPFFGLWGFLSSVSLWVGAAIFCSVVGSLGVLTVKSLLGYSSVFGLGWLLMMADSGWLWSLFLSVYMAGVLCFLLPFYWTEGEAMIGSGAAGVSGPAGLLALAGGLSMAGFPPFPGFIMKLSAISWGAMSGLGSPLLVLLVAVSVFFLALYLSALVRSLMAGEGSWRTPPFGSLGPMALFVFVVIPIATWLFPVGVTHESFWVSST